MSVVSESADNEFEMGSRRGDLLGRKTSWLISSCCSLAYPLYYCNTLGGRLWWRGAGCRLRLSVECMMQNAKMRFVASKVPRITSLFHHFTNVLCSLFLAGTSPLFFQHYNKSSSRTTSCNTIKQDEVNNSSRTALHSILMLFHGSSLHNNIRGSIINHTSSFRITTHATIWRRGSITILW